MQDFLLILHLLGVAMAVGTGFAMTSLGIGTRDMEISDRTKFTLRTFIVSKTGSIGFGILILSGLMLLLPAWPAVKSNWTFHTKLFLVIVQGGLLGYMHSLITKAKKANGGSIMSRIPSIGTAMQINGILIIIFAVLTFN